jgi:hypothetical protein
MYQNKRGLFSLGMILVVIMLLFLAIGGTIWIFKNKDKSEDNNSGKVSVGGINNSIGETPEDINNSIENTPNFNESKQTEDTEESVVSRSLSSKTIAPDEQIEITLSVDVRNKETYFVIEEYLPLGWTVISDGGGATNEENKLSWLVFGMFPVSDSNIKYTLRASSLIGEYNFEGIYQFEGMNNEANILGDTTVTII